MASLSYDDIYSRVLEKITDYGFLELTDSEIYENLTRKMKIALSKPYLRRLFSSIVYDDEIQVLTYTLNYNSSNAEADNDFICEAIALGIVVAWLEPKVKTTNLIHQQFTSSKESKWYNQKDLYVVPIEPKIHRTLALIAPAHRDLTMVEKTFIQIMKDGVDKRLGFYAI